ncbi:MAG TPA: MG2 domain-containing protein [Kofleriaceae bacterium]|nr:MG2 domain-containing protein [Kofleriaceae bacterium]
MLLASCGGPAGPRTNDVQVTSFAPRGPIERSEPITIRFDRPVVGEDQVGKPADPRAISVAPPFAWTGHWQDPQTLVIDPEGQLAPSTRYDVTLAGELGKRTADFRFSFVHAPLVIEGLSGDADADMFPPDGAIPLAFNQPVLPADAIARCKLAGADGAQIPLSSAGAAPAPQLSLRPVKVLAAGAAYTLACEGLGGAGGNATMDQRYTLALRARPVAAVTSIEPGGNDVPADEAQLTVTFSTPVALDAARKAVSSTPAIPRLAMGDLSEDGMTYTVTTDLEVETSYRIKVAGLTDTFGQQLAAPREHRFKTNNGRPRLSMERGIFALEASAKGYPLWSRNVGKLELECAAIPKDRVVQVLTSDMSYDPWGGYDDSGPIDWKKLRLTARKATLRPKSKRWVLHELELGKQCGGAPGGRGVFLAEVSSDEVTPDADRGWLSPRKNRVLANVTDLGILLKVGTSSGVVWVTSLATGAPVGDAKVTVFDPQGRQVWTGATGADGVAKIPGSAVLKKQGPRDPAEEEYEEWDSYRSQRLIAVVEKDGDTGIVDGNWSNGIQSWNFGVTEDRRGGATKIRGFIQSDRGLYRPGEKVHFKGIVREIAHGRPPRVPAGKPVEIEIQDSRGETVKQTKARLSAFGGFAFDHALPADAATGDYHVRAKVADQVFRERFSVEEFRAATFELSLKGTTAAPRPGQPLAFALGAKYLFGAPASGANVDWRLRKRDHVLRFPGYESYSFSANPRIWWWYRDDNDYGELVAEGTGTTDAQGRLAITARDDARRFEGPIDYILSANVTDEADQTMGKSVVVTAHKTGLYLGLFANEYVQAAGMPFGVNLVALRPDGTRAAAKAKLSFTKTDHACTWTSAGARSFESCTPSEKKVMEREVAIAAAGSHTERIFPTEPGAYVLKIEAKDDRGNAVVAASQLYVIGKGEAFWSGDEGDRMTVVAGKPSYQVGETARLVAQANLEQPTALITIERDGVMEARVVKLGSASEGIELPIADAWAPNVYASIALVSGRKGAGDAKRPKFKLGVVELTVSAAPKQLDVEVALDRDTVRPGEPVSGKIKVTSAGAPVRAEVSLSAADEGVLQLISYVTPNPMKTFYKAYGLGVDSGTNWNRIARLADPEAGDPDMGGDAGSTLNGQRVRSKFVASAYWAPMLVTDERGEIAFAFKAPDNLTAFRLMAVAADVGERFGAGERRLTVNQPLMAAPALPRFLRAGDAASVGVVVHNHTDAAGTATVTAKATGATLDAMSQRAWVPANGSVRVRFAAKASEQAAATFEFAVAMGAERDAVRVTLPVDRPRVIDRRLVATQRLAAGEAWSGSLGVGADVLRGESTLSVTVDRSGVGDLAPSLRSLVEYPYGCLEQTMSRFLPLVAAKDLAKTLDDPTLQGTKAAAFIRAGLEKVLRHQQGDGLFSLWPESQTYPHLTAYALWGLTVAQRAGEPVPADALDRGVAALAAWANGAGNLRPDGDGATIAMAAYVMALRGKPDAGLNARLYALRGGLPKWGLAFLLRAMKLAKADPAEIAELQKVIAAGITVRDGRATVSERSSYDHAPYMSSDVRAAAMTLAALLEVEPQSPLIDPLAAGLKAARDRTGAWGSTQENLWSLVALAQYGRRSAGGDTTVTITAGGKQLARRKLAGGGVATITASLGALAGDDLQISTDHGGVISARVTEARVDAGATVANGFAIARRYTDAAGKEVTSFAAGDVVTVKLTVTADQARRWVALVDPIPAGFEVMNPKLAAGGVAQPAAGAASSRPSYWRSVAWDHQEMRDDRVLWFADHMRAGTFELEYQARATIDGTFTAMPATIEAMYEPELRARTARARVTVTK